jgi:hypothetical protein
VLAHPASAMARAKAATIFPLHETKRFRNNNNFIFLQ